MTAGRTKVTRIRKQYLSIKSQYPDAILFFRLGDFYETFDNDAETTARELDIVLTSRSTSKGVAIPMAGVPHHAAENYIARLIGRGYHVAICEQIGSETVRGILPREVVRVVTPGTVIEPGMLESGRNNYLAAVVLQGRDAGFAFVDITTGEFRAAQFSSDAVDKIILDEITRISPAELLVPDDMSHKIFLKKGVNVSQLPQWKFESASSNQILCDHFDVSTLSGFGIGDKKQAIRASGAILHYLGNTQSGALRLLSSLATYNTNDYMQLDAATRRNLELTKTAHSGEALGSLLQVLDDTVTPMGGRLLRQWISRPLLDVAAINERLDGVSSVYDNGVLRSRLRDNLRSFGDLERLVNRAMGAIASPRDMGIIRDVLKRLPALKRLLNEVQSETKCHALLELEDRIDLAPEILDMLKHAIVDDPPANLQKPGSVRRGWSEELDHVVATSRSARDWIAGLEVLERKRTGIKSLKVRYNKVFGYFIEVTKANAEMVPDEYIRKQTLVNAERYITPDLKEYETTVLNAEEQMLAIERRVFSAVCSEVGEQAAGLLRTARAIAHIDVLTSLAEAAARMDYVRPKVVEDDVLEIIGGRHAVVEQTMQHSGYLFVPNDCRFLPHERVWVITGPNMSGKSTFLRQVALCVLMAQVGSFVPAESAHIGVVDRIFTRIGSRDEIHAGQSTFMVEMVEAADILNNATPSSLVILDEIGRGTSTYDGLALAWSIIEHLHDHPGLGSKTLFATHYHELTDLENQLSGVSNYNVAVSEEGDDVVFLHQIVDGGADRSYGIHVARLAGVPKAAVHRAEEILTGLEALGRGVVSEAPKSEIGRSPLGNELLRELEQLGISSMSPLEALNKLFEWQQRYKSRDG